MRIGTGRPSIDFNGTRYTQLEGSAADSNISIDGVRGKGRFDPLKQSGIALTTQQAKALGVKVGDTVNVRDNKTGRLVSATFYDSAGSRRAGNEKMAHFEVSPKLADELGINYRNRSGKVVDAVTNAENLAGRFSIERASSSTATATARATSTSTSTSSTTGSGVSDLVSKFDGRYRQAPSTSAVTSGKAELRLGDSGEAVRLLQRSLGVTVDGKFGAQTLRALDAAKTQHGLTGQLGRAGATTFSKLVGADRFNASPTSSRVAAQQTSSTSRSGTAPGNLTAKFEGTEKVGQTNQLKTGKITINGNTYDFTSGGWGRGNLPAGSYRVSGGVSTSESGMVVGGVGFKFNLSNKYDSRVGGATRSGLLIHPDGGSRGTAGCIGIVGNGAVQRRFAQDMKAELARRGGSFILNVG